MGKIIKNRGYFDVYEYGQEGRLLGMTPDKLEELAFDIVDHLGDERKHLLKCYIEGRLVDGN